MRRASGGTSSRCRLMRVSFWNAWKSPKWTRSMESHRHRDPAKEYHPQPALDGGDIDRVLRLPAIALRPGGPHVLSAMRAASGEGHGGPGGFAADGARRRLALVRS